MRRVIYFFPDTNLFLQCSPLDQLDWSCFGADRVDLVVTRPMIAEVDSHKGKGNGRTAKRARKAASDIGQALTSDTGYLSLGKGTIEVRLCIEAMLKENKDLTDQRHTPNAIISLLASRQNLLQIIPIEMSEC